MTFLHYIVWGAALFFASGWTLALFLRPLHKAYLAIVIVWWVEIICAATFLNVLHLLWLMPLSLFVVMTIL